jgi:hypothetical protein
MSMDPETRSYNAALAPAEGAICRLLAREIDRQLPAQARYTAVGQVDTEKLRRWLAEAREVQWDYKNIVRRRGRLVRLR